MPALTVPGNPIGRACLGKTGPPKTVMVSRSAHRKAFPWGIKSANPPAFAGQDVTRPSKFRNCAGQKDDRAASPARRTGSTPSPRASSAPIARKVAWRSFHQRSAKVSSTAVLPRSGGAALSVSG